MPQLAPLSAPTIRHAMDGDSTSDAATKNGRAVGEHSSTADANGDEPGREGLGNFAGGEKGNKDGQSGNKNPSDLGDIVNGQLPP